MTSVANLPIKYNSKRYNNERYKGYTFQGDEFFQTYEPRGSTKDGEGTCKMENAMLFMEYYLIHDKATSIEDLRYKHIQVKRITDGHTIHHFIITYRENGKLYMEDRSNGIHKKLFWNAYKKANKIKNIIDMTDNLKSTIRVRKNKDGEPQLTFCA